MKKIVFIAALLAPLYSFAGFFSFFHRESFSEYIQRMTNLCSEHYNWETEEVLTTNEQALTCLRLKSAELIQFRPIVEFNSDRNLNFQNFKVSQLGSATEDALAKVRYQMKYASQDESAPQTQTQVQTNEIPPEQQDNHLEKN